MLPGTASLRPSRAARSCGWTCRCRCRRRWAVTAGQCHRGQGRCDCWPGRCRRAPSAGRLNPGLPPQLACDLQLGRGRTMRQFRMLGVLLLVSTPSMPRGRNGPQAGGRNARPRACVREGDQRRALFRRDAPRRQPDAGDGNRINKKTTGRVVIATARARGGKGSRERERRHLVSSIRGRHLVSLDPVNKIAWKTA